MKTTVTERTPASTVRTMNLLSDVLMNLLEKQSLEKISITDICAKAQVPRATFYNHFEDKYDLFRYSMRTIFNAITAKNDSAFDETSYITHEIDNILNFAKNNYNYLRKVNSANSNGILFAEIKDMLYDRLLERMTALKKMGKLFPIKEQIIAEIYANAIVYSAKTWIEKDMIYSESEVREALLIMISK